MDQKHNVQTCSKVHMIKYAGEIRKREKRGRLTRDKVFRIELRKRRYNSFENILTTITIIDYHVSGSVFKQKKKGGKKRNFQKNKK